MNKKKTVWCISKYASPPIYGVGARLFYIAREFCDLDFDVMLISSDSNHLALYPDSNQIYNEEHYDDLLHVWIKTRKYKKNASVQRILSWLDFEYKLFRLDRKKYTKPDIVIVSSLSLLTILYGIFLKKRYHCKLIFEIRDIHPLTLIEEFGISKWNPLIIMLGFLEKIGYKKADLIVGTMPNLKAHVRKILGHEKEVFHSPLGIHEIWSSPVQKNDEIDSLFPPKGKFIVGYAGSMGVSNALNPFIEAIESMSGTPDLHFVIVGSGDMKKQITERVSGLSNVTIGPKISQKDIPYFLSKCDLLYLSVHDSKVWKYGQSLNKLIDYMMAGKPVLASYSGYPSMLNEAQAGFFVPTGAVETIVENILIFKNMAPEERNVYGIRGRKWIQENNSYKTITIRYQKRLLDLFEE